MSKTLLVLGAILLIAAPAFGATLTVSKTGEQADVVPGGASTPSQLRADFEWNSGGSIDFIPDTGGSATGWAEYFITAVQNTTGQDLQLVELGFPCDGPATGTYGWLVWIDAAVPPGTPGPATTAQYYGAFTPVSNTGTFPPTVYTYIDVSTENMIVPDGSWLWFGYDNTGYGGMTSYNGVETWGWYGGVWDPDGNWGRTAILQVKANYAGPVPTEQSTWGQVKQLYR